MNKIKNLVRLILFLGIFIFPSIASGVTQKEMEQARTIAAKSYLRYANDGSGYLDDLNPTTMQELEASLKTKEKENIKAFKEIPVPTDYKDWDKDKLVEYWAVTAFQNKGLLEKGRGGRIRARSQINKMTIAPPQAETETPAPAPQTVVTENNQQAATEAPSALDNLSQLKADEEAIQNEEIAEEEDMNVDKAGNYTWVYIMALAILVGIVIALVVYATNVLKKNGMKNISGQNEPRRPQRESEDLEHFQSLVADKDMEINMLKKKLESANRQNSEMKIQVETLSAELAALKSMDRQGPSVPKTGLRTIYLGRANSRGVFIRADRNLNIGNSVYVLETSDGFSGSFKVADSPQVWEMALSDPREYLETACTGHYLDNPRSATRIATEASGTAVFEGGCWRVIRKARIRYES